MIPVNKWWLGVVCLITLFACPQSNAQDRTIVLSGTVVTPQKVLKKGWVVIKQGRISQVETKTAPQEANAIVLDTDYIIFPGFVDLHNHPIYAALANGWKPKPNQTFNNRYEWRALDEYREKVTRPAGELQREDKGFCDLVEFADVQALIGGTTSFSGIFPRRPPASFFPACLSLSSVRKLDYHSGFYTTELGTERIQNVLGVTPFDFSDAAANEVTRKLAANELDLVLIHVAEGKHAEPEDKKPADLESSLEFTLLKGRSLLGPNTAVIHGIAFTNSDFRNMRSAATALVWSPVSNMNLYGHTTDVIAAFREGVLIALAPDWAPSGSINMLAELKEAAKLNQKDLGGFFSNQQLFEMATSIPARIARIDDKVGVIQPGLLADLFLLRGDTTRPFDALVRSGLQDVALVFINGVPVYGDPKLMSSFNAPTEPLSICGASKSLNLDVFPNGKVSDAEQRISDKLKTYKIDMARLDDCRQY